MCLSVCQCVCLSVNVSVCPSKIVTVPWYLFFCVLVHMYVFPSVRGSVCLPICQQAHLSISLSFHLSASGHLYKCSSICLFVYLKVYLFSALYSLDSESASCLFLACLFLLVCSSAHLFICLSFCL
jgi:hypothetical protein